MVKEGFQFALGFMLFFIVFAIGALIVESLIAIGRELERREIVR